MKQLTCEMCGSTDLVKQDGVFVCQSCGCKYSVEEAKKMMIEGTVSVQGTVEVQGTVQIDNSASVEKYLANARRAKQKEDWEEAEKYYNWVEQNDPSNIEAVFYSAYAKARLSLADPNLTKRKNAFKAYQNSISLLDDHFDMDNSSELRKMIIQISDDIIALGRCGAEYNYLRDEKGNIIGSDSAKTFELKESAEKEFFTTLNNIADKYPEEQKNERIFYYKLILKHVELILEQRVRDRAWLENLFTTYHSKIKQIDSHHSISDMPKPKGCYIATAVYGSYDCPKVWTLRRFRDYTLAESWYGRAFIRTYYAISPTIVRWFGKTEWFKKMWQGPLDRMVAKLNAEGVEDTPYRDRNW